MPSWTRRLGRMVFFAACITGIGGSQPAAAPCDTDERCQAVRTLFRRHQSPLAEVAPVFVQAADRHGLDWRLLPAISIVETGGRQGRVNNVFGWNSGRARFKTAEHCILFVAERLAKSPTYAGRTALEILRQYNPARKSYPPRVAKVMLEISDDPVR